MYITGLPALQEVESGKSSSQLLAGKDDFLKLLTTQLKHQDPLSPQDNNQFMVQIAQLSMVEQMQNLNDTLEHFFQTEQQFQSISLLDKKVIIDDTDGTQITGKVESISFTPQGPKVVVDGQEYFLSQVQQVEVTGDNNG